MNWLRAFASKVMPNGSFARGVFTLASSAAGAQLISVLASPLLTRLYTPEDFGVLAVFVATLGVLSVMSCLRYELAIPLIKTRSGALNIFILAITVNLLFALIAGICIAIFHKPIANFLGAPVLATYLWILPVGIVFVGAYRALAFLAVREKSFDILGRTKLSQALSGAIIQLGIGAVHSGPFGLIAGQVISQSAGMMTLGRQFSQRFDCLMQTVNRKRIATLAIRHSGFPKYDLPAAGLNTLSANLPQFLLAALFSPAVAGFYLLAHRVINMPVAILGQAIGQGLYAHAREAATDGRLLRFVSQIAAVLALMTLAPLLIVSMYGETLFSWVFGASWDTAGVYASWLVLGASVQFIYSPISLMLLATDSQHINLVIQVVLLTIRIVAIGYGYMNDDALASIMALAYADATGYLFGFVLTMIRIKQHQKRQRIMGTAK